MGGLTFSTLDSWGEEIQALDVLIALSSNIQDTLQYLTVPLFTQEYTWVQVNCQGNPADKELGELQRWTVKDLLLEFGEK